jgi:ATP-dependent protease ClpP protease subunit
MKKWTTEDIINHIHQYGLDTDSHEVYLTGEESYSFGASVDHDSEEPGVEYLMASKFIKNLNILSKVAVSKNKYLPITIHMKTDGGFWAEGMAIYDAIRACPNPTTIVNYTHARSMSSIIFQAADRRIMMPNSVSMFHLGTYSISGTVKQVESNVKFDRKDTDTMLEVYASRMRQKGKFYRCSKAKIKKWLLEQMDKREDVYLTAEQTVEYGLADEIFKSWRHIRK